MGQHTDKEKNNGGEIEIYLGKKPGSNPHREGKDHEEATKRRVSIEEHEGEHLFFFTMLFFDKVKKTF